MPTLQRVPRESVLRFLETAQMVRLRLSWALEGEGFWMPVPRGSIHELIQEDAAWEVAMDVQGTLWIARVEQAK